MSARQATQRGYVMISVLLLAVLISSMVLGYARHAVMAADTSQAVVAAQRAEDAADSGLAWARQSLAADGADQADLALADGSRLSIRLADSGPTLRSIAVQATGHGYQQTMSAQAEIYATLGEALPTLTTVAQAAVAASPSVTEITGTQTLADTDLSGILYLRDGASLTLHDVTLKGAIISEGAFAGPGTTSQLHIEGGLLIEPGLPLRGCAIVMPDGAVTGSGDERLQIEGVIVADRLVLPGTGALHSPIATAQPASLAAAIDRPGEGRAPRPWPTALDTRAEGFARVVFPPVTVSSGERSAIQSFGFPPTGGSP
jgi:hypothetical protein